MFSMSLQMEVKAESHILKMGVTAAIFNLEGTLPS